MLRGKFASVGVGLSLVGVVTSCSSAGGKTPAAFSSPAGGSRSPSPRLVAWFDGGGKRVLTAISSDLGAIRTAAGNVDVTALGSAATRLKVDVGHAKTYAPIPDAASQEEWSEALTECSTGANDEIAGAANADPTSLAAATTELNDATANLKAATALVPTS